MAYELFFDGFESYGAGTGLDMMKFGYTHTGGAPQFANMPAGRRANTKCLYLVSSYYFNFRRPITPSTHVVVGMALKQIMGGTQIVAQLREGETVHAQCVVPGSGALALSVGGGNAVTSANTQPANIWNHFQIGVHCADAGSYEVRVNGSSQGWFPSTNADTRNGGAGVIDNVLIYCTGGESGLIDDFYIAYGDELAWLGDRRIDLLTLDANDTPQDWTPSSGNAWERLNAGDGYVASNIDEATSLFTLANLPYTPESIDGIAVRSLMDKSDAGARSAAALIKSGATEVESSELALSTDTLGVTKVFAKDPATNAAWTTNAVNALKAGVRVKS